MVVKAFVIWIILLILAVLNGGIREVFLRPHVGEQVGHVISTLVLCGVLCLVAWISVPWIRAHSLRDRVHHFHRHPSEYD